jgi:hypothetical protein
MDVNEHVGRTRWLGKQETFPESPLSRARGRVPHCCRDRYEEGERSSVAEGRGVSTQLRPFAHREAYDSIYVFYTSSTISGLVRSCRH